MNLNSLINFLLFFATQMSLIFIPLLAKDLGASDFEVGLVVSAYGGAFLVSSLFFGWKSDSFGRLVFIRRGLLATSLAFFFQLFDYNLFMLIIARFMVGFTMGIVSAALVAYVYETEGHMGKFSSYGSLGWIFGSLVAAIFKDCDTLFIFSFTVCLIAFFVSFKLKETSTSEEKKVIPNLFEVVHKNYRVYLAIFLRHLGAQSVWTIMPLYLVSLGADRLWVGLLWSINFTVQFFVMRYVEKFDERKVFALGQVVSILVFLAYAFATHYLQLVVVQIALGISWSCLYVGALLIVLGCGEERGTAGGVFQSTLNLCQVLGPFIGGTIAQGWGYKGTMLFAAAIGFAGLTIAIPREKKTSEKTI